MKGLIMPKVSSNKKQRDSELLARRALQVQRGAARAAVLGVNDGLVSILCIVLAVAGAGAATSDVLLAGFAGLLAGAVSMAAGEWISVQSQVELFRGILKDLKRMVKNDRELLMEQIADKLSDSGHGDKTARTAAAEIGENDAHLSSVYASQVMGFNPDELGSPWIAAGSSFFLFTMGSLAPLAPWVFTSGATAIWLSIIFTGLASLVVGGYVGRTSGSSVAYGAVRQLLIVLFAAAVTYGVGYLFGVSV
jgi:VIT1/CCC1 family predicted Fe2+/Mn2+ transporter